MESPSLTDSLAGTRASFLDSLHSLRQNFLGHTSDAPKTAGQGSADQSGTGGLTISNAPASAVVEVCANGNVKGSHVTDNAFLKLITDVSKNNEETSWALEKSHIPSDNQVMASGQNTGLAIPPTTPNSPPKPSTSDVLPRPATSPGGRQKSDTGLWERQICWANLGKAPHAPLYYFVQQLPFSAYGIRRDEVFDADYKIIPKERKIGKYKTDWGTMEEALVLCPPIMYARKTIYFQVIKLEHPDNYLIDNEAMKDTTKDVEALCTISTCKHPQGWDFVKNVGPLRAKQRKNTKFFASDEDENDEEALPEKDQVKWVYRIWASADLDGQKFEVDLIVQQDDCLGKPAPTYVSAVQLLQNHMWNWIQPMLQHKHRSTQANNRTISKQQKQSQQQPQPYPPLINGYSQGKNLGTIPPNLSQPSFGVLASNPAQSAEIDKYFQRSAPIPPPNTPMQNQVSTGVLQQRQLQQMDALQTIKNGGGDGNYRGPYQPESHNDLIQKHSPASMPATQGTNFVPNMNASGAAEPSKLAKECSTQTTKTIKPQEQSSNGVPKPPSQGSMSPTAGAGSKRKIDQVEIYVPIKAENSHVSKRLHTSAQSPHTPRSSQSMRSQNMIYPPQGSTHHNGVPSNQSPIPQSPHHNRNGDRQNSQHLSPEAMIRESQTALASIIVGLPGLEKGLMNPQLSTAGKADLEQKIQYALHGKSFHENRLAQIHRMQKAGTQASTNSPQPGHQIGQIQPPTSGLHEGPGQAFMNSQAAGTRSDVHGQQRRNSGVQPFLPQQAAQTNTARYQGNPPSTYQAQSLRNSDHGWPSRINGMAPIPQPPQGPNMIFGHPPRASQRPSNSPPQMIQSPAAQSNGIHHSQQHVQDAHQRVPSNGQGSHQHRNVQHMNRGQMPQNGQGQQNNQNPFQLVGNYQDRSGGQGSHHHQSFQQPITHSYNPPNSGLLDQQYLRSLNQGHNGNDGVRLVSAPGPEQASGAPPANTNPPAQLLAEQNDFQNATVNSRHALQTQGPRSTPTTIHAHGQDTTRSDRAQVTDLVSLDNLQWRRNQAFSSDAERIARQKVMRMVADTNGEPIEDLQRRLAARQNSSVFNHNQMNSHDPAGNSNSHGSNI